MGKLTVRNVKMAGTNGSDFNLYAADLLVENCEFGGPSRFWAELTARANQMNSPMNQCVFRNNSFHDAVGATGIAITQGDFQRYSFTFSNNTFTRASSGIFGLYGGVAGPVSISGNTIDSCNTVLEFGQAPGWINSPVTANVTMEANTITHGMSLVSFFGSQSNIVVRNNTFSGKDPGNKGLSTAVVYGAATIHSALVEGNSFTDCRTPEQSAGIDGERPFFRNNRYLNVERRDRQGSFGISSAGEPWASPFITPHFEEVQLDPSQAAVIAQLDTALYPDGQCVTFKGLRTDNAAEFAVGGSGYTVAQDRYVKAPADSLKLWYSSATHRWVETPPASPAKAVASFGSKAIAQSPRLVVSHGGLAVMTQRGNARQWYSVTGRSMHAASIMMRDRGGK
jgi:hypothetical protein